MGSRCEIESCPDMSPMTFN